MRSKGSFNVAYSNRDFSGGDGASHMQEAVSMKIKSLTVSLKLNQTDAVRSKVPGRG